MRHAKIVILRRRSDARPGRSILKKRAWRLTSRPKCVFYDAFRRVQSLDQATSGQSIVKIEAPNGWKNVQLYPAFSPSTTPIHRKNRCITPHGWKLCHFTSRFCRRSGPGSIELWGLGPDDQAPAHGKVYWGLQRSRQHSPLRRALGWREAAHRRRPQPAQSGWCMAARQALARTSLPPPRLHASSHACSGMWRRKRRSTRPL